MFVEEANIALKIELNKDDFDGLIQILSILNTINEKQFIYDYMFEPLKEIVDLLKTYNYEFCEADLMMVSGESGECGIDENEFYDSKRCSFSS